MDKFLPKAFDLDVNDSYCSDYQYGTNKTLPHWHSGAEIIFVVKGRVGIMFNDSWHTLEGGSMVFIPPKQLHCCNCEDDTAEKIVLGFKEKCLGTGGVGLSLPSDVLRFCVLHKLDSTRLPTLIKEFNELARTGLSYSEDLMARAILLQIYSILTQHWASQGIDLDLGTQSKAMSKIYKHIEAHYMEELSPYEIARQFHMSYSSLAKAIQRYRHITFTKYVNQVRIENAKRLLTLTDKSITEIGLECGFSVTSYFIKIFQGFTNMTPKDYRGLIKNRLDKG
ncbi:MAG: helix-turn-helix transcriptional regulator [Clostridia bacterium]|nr:helix-turn-helix transcriptional regulator [Clostridia bacterium]